MEENLREAVLEAKRITSHEAKRRQMQYVGKLMRKIDPAPMLRERLEAIDRPLGAGGARSTAASRRWRERLLADDEALTAFAAEHPGADLQALRTLIRNARKEQKDGEAAARLPRALPPDQRMLRAPAPPERRDHARAAAGARRYAAGPAAHHQHHRRHVPRRAALGPRAAGRRRLAGDPRRRRRRPRRALHAGDRRTAR